MKQLPYLVLALLLLPQVSLAASLQEKIASFSVFLINIGVPFLLGIGFLFFAINVVRFFIAGAGNEEGREKAKNLAIYSVLGFVVIIIFWGTVNMLAQSIGLNETAPVSDYVGGSNPTQGTTQNNQGNTNTPTNILPTQNDTAEQNGNVACRTTTSNGGSSIIITTPAACTASGGTPQ